MRASPERIRQAILHAEGEIRRTALRYFSDSWSQDATVMPLVVRAVEQYGREAGCALLRDAGDLVQTEDTLRWLEDQLRGPLDPSDLVDDDYRWAAALTLCAADPAQLLAGHADAAKLPCFPEPLVEYFHKRLDMHAWDWDRAWNALVDLGRKALAQGSFRPEDGDLEHLLLEALARCARGQGGPEERLWDLVERTGDARLRDWLRPAMMDLLGRVGAEESAQSLVEALDDDETAVSEAASSALVRIGGDEVVRRIARQWAQGSEDFRYAAGGVLDHVHTDLAAETCLRLFAEAQDLDLRVFLAQTMLLQLCPAAVEPVRRLLVEELEPDDAAAPDLRHALVAAATVMGVSFPEYDAWYAQAVAERWGWEDYQPGRLADRVARLGVTGPGYRHPGFLDELEPDGLDHEADEWEEEFEEEEEEEEEWDDADWGEDTRDETPPPLRRPAAPGRNDPCPCGSGLKYKKCCMRKEETPREDDWPV